jgi:hypothetical protein
MSRGISKFFSFKSKLQDGIQILSLNFKNPWFEFSNQIPNSISKIFQTLSSNYLILIFELMSKFLFLKYKPFILFKSLLLNPSKTTTQKYYFFPIDFFLSARNPLSPQPFLITKTFPVTFVVHEAFRPSSAHVHLSSPFSWNDSSVPPPPQASQPPPPCASRSWATRATTSPPLLTGVASSFVWPPLLHLLPSIPTIAPSTSIRNHRSPSSSSRFLHPASSIRPWWGSPCPPLAPLEPPRWANMHWSRCVALFRWAHRHSPVSSSPWTKLPAVQELTESTRFLIEK